MNLYDECLTALLKPRIKKVKKKNCPISITYNSFFNNNFLKNERRNGEQNVYRKDLNFIFNKLYLLSNFNVNLLDFHKK